MPTPASAHFEAWGGRMTVLAADPAGLAPALAAVRETVSQFDAACSSFRPDSELAALNRSAGRPFIAGPLLLDAVEAALRAAELSDGAVDPTVGEALVAYGFTPAPAAPVERPGAPAAPAPGVARVPGHHAIRLDRQSATIRLPRGVRLDLGASAKALAADRAAAAAGEAAGCGVLVALMGDVAVAGSAPDCGWRLRVTDDHRAEETAPGQWVAITGGGLATSSTAVRGRGAHPHVIDPATSRPVRGEIRTATVAAATCLDANTASTAAIVRGLRAADWLEANRLPSRLVLGDGTVRHLAGWPHHGEDLAAAAMRGVES